MNIKRKHLIILLLFLGYIMVYLDKTVIGLIIVKIEKDFSLTPTDIGYITGFFFLSYSIFQIPAGWLNDRIGYKKMLLFSLTLVSFFAICFGLLGYTASLLIVFRFLSGIGHSGYPSSCAKTVSANFEVSERTFAQSILLSSSGVALIIGPIIIGYLLKIIDWRLSFVSIGIITFIIAILILIFIPNQPITKSDESTKVNYFDLLKNPTILLLLLANFGLNIPAYGLMAWLPKYLMNERGLDLSMTSYIIATTGLAQWLSSLISGWFVGRYMYNREHIVIFVSSLIGAVLIWILYNTQNILMTFIIIFIAYFFLMAAFVTTFTLPMKRLPESIIGSAVGLLNSGGVLGGFVAPITIGYLVISSDGSTNFSSAFIFLMSSMILTALVILPLKKKEPATK